MLFQEILKSPYGSQAVNGVYMYANTQCKNENQGQRVVKIIDICDSCTHEIFPVAGTTQFKLFWGLKKSCKVVYQSNVT